MLMRVVAGQILGYIITSTLMLEVIWTAMPDREWCARMLDVILHVAVSRDA